MPALGAAVFLDRDGVLNEVIIRDGHPHSPPDVPSFRIFQDVPDSLTRLKRVGFALVVATNQPNVARGLQTREVVDGMNAVLMATLPLDEIRVCYHDDGDGCGCRKPRPGLLLSGPEYDLRRSFMIGDRWQDIEAGRRAGCRTIWIDRGYAEPRARADACVNSLASAVDWILRLRTAAEG